MRKKVLVSWSTGKDSAYTLYKLLQSDEVEVVGLLTIITKEYNRVSIHGIRESLVDVQAKRLGLPVYKMYIYTNYSFENYNNAYQQFLIEEISKYDITHIAYGDIFLEELRKQREKQLSITRLKPLFPLWYSVLYPGCELSKVTQYLSMEIIRVGIKAKVCCVSPKKLDKDLLQHDFNQTFLNKLPTLADRCGEYGEFHTFTYDSPNFSHPIKIIRGDIINKETGIFQDLYHI